MAYSARVLPFQSRPFGGQWLLVSATGDHLFASDAELGALQAGRVEDLPLGAQARLRAKHFVQSDTAIGSRTLRASRIGARHETLGAGPSLHILVPTLQCEHSCQYCQVSRSLSDTTHTMSEADLMAACESIFESQADVLTVEFQGGDPLLRFDLVQAAILRIEALRQVHQRRVRYVIASTLHQLDEAKCAFLQQYGVVLSTSIDGPEPLHNKNRPTKGRDAYQRTVAGIELARRLMGPHAVSALMTTTKASLASPEEIVDEYVKLGFREVFLRPLSSYGFAKRNQVLLGYRLSEFQDFYARALERVLHWNRQGVEVVEVYASIILNKILSPFDAGYVDLQSPTGAGQSVLVYNYDGFVYPSDEARMLAETGDVSLRLGRIGTPLADLQGSSVQQSLQNASRVDLVEGCTTCAFQTFCAPNPVDSQAQFGFVDAPVESTEHCQRHQWLFDHFFDRIQRADPDLLDLFHVWSRSARPESEACVV